jgi:hypothetical protein
MSSCLAFRQSVLITRLDLCDNLLFLLQLEPQCFVTRLDRGQDDISAFLDLVQTTDWRNARQSSRSKSRSIRRGGQERYLTVELAPTLPNRLQSSTSKKPSSQNCRKSWRNSMRSRSKTWRRSPSPKTLARHGGWTYFCCASSALHSASRS